MAMLILGISGVSQTELEPSRQPERRVGCEGSEIRARGWCSVQPTGDDGGDRQGRQHDGAVPRPRGERGRS